MCASLAPPASARQAGYTSFSVGLCNNRVVYLPITALVENSPRAMNANGRTWERVLSVTGQPNTAVRDDDRHKVRAQSSRTTL